MAIKFPIRLPEAGEVVHPDDLNLNFKEFVDELNGNIDSDNLKNDFGTAGKITNSCFADESFTECLQDTFNSVRSPSGMFECSHETTGFISTDDNGVERPSVEFNAEADGWIIVDFAASHI